MSVAWALTYNPELQFSIQKWHMQYPLIITEAANILLALRQHGLWVFALEDRGIPNFSSKVFTWVTSYTIRPSCRREELFSPHTAAPHLVPSMVMDQLCLLSAGLYWSILWRPEGIQISFKSYSSAASAVVWGWKISSKCLLRLAFDSARALRSRQESRKVLQSLEDPMSHETENLKPSWLEPIAMADQEGIFLPLQLQSPFL